jgi:opacity protein-like surface antigen
MIAAMMLMSIGAFAQSNVYIKPMVGGSLATLVGDVENNKMKIGLVVGGELGYNLSENMALTAGVLYSMQGTGVKDHDENINMDYLNVPILFNYYVAPGLAIKAGVQPAYRVKARMEHDGQRIDMDRALETLLEDDDMKINKFDLAIPVGLSYEYNGLTLDARYNFGITKLFSNFEDDVRHKCVVITLGYKF